MNGLDGLFAAQMKTMRADLGQKTTRRQIELNQSMLENT
jgi:hypothetical protein